jgi:hypothetical protein
MWNCHLVQAYPFRSAEIALCKMFAAQIIFAQHFCRVNTARLADFLCPYFGTGQKKEKYIILQMFAFFNIFSQEVWVKNFMQMGYIYIAFS